MLTILVFQVYSKVDGGYSKWMGKILEELSMATLTKAKRQKNADEISRGEFLKRTQEAMKQLKKAIQCRQFELDFSQSSVAKLLMDFNDIISSC